MSNPLIAIENDACITIRSGKKANIRKYAISAAAEVRPFVKKITIKRRIKEFSSLINFRIIISPLIY